MRPAGFDRVLATVQQQGLLLLADPRRLSVATLVAGGPVRGSWWGHPRGQAIFAVASRLEDHPDVLVVKLVAGKVTFVHRRLWPAVLAVATERAPWQTRALSPAARALLRRVAREGEVQVGPGGRAAGKVLEARLLVRGGEVHTASGAHAKVLESWSRWAERCAVAKGMDPGVARGILQQAAGTAPLPWVRTTAAARRSAAA